MAMLDIVTAAVARAGAAGPDVTPGTVAAWDAWLEQYPKAALVPEAKRAREEAAQFELAAKVNTKVMWRAFLKAWPQGRHELDAELRLRE